MSGNDNNTILLYHFDNNLLDSAVGGSGNNATITGTTTYNASGKFGSSLVFNAFTTVSSPRFIPTSFFNSNSFTIDFWVRKTTPSAAFTIWGISDGGPDPYVQIGINESHGTQKFYLKYYGITTSVFLSTFTLTQNVWAHIAIVKQQGTPNVIKVYANGVQTGNTFSVWPVARGLVGLNALPQRNSEFDEMRFSNIARWTTNFTPPTAPYSAPAPPSPQNMLLCWQFYGVRENGKTFTLNGEGDYPKEIEIPADIDIDSCYLIDEGIEIDKSNYSIKKID